jgi:hypothetical protein
MKLMNPGFARYSAIRRPPGLDVTEHVAVATQEYDAVAGWIRFVPFEFVVRDFNFGSDVDMRPAARLVGPKDALRLLCSSTHQIVGVLSAFKARDEVNRQCDQFRRTAD